MAHRLCTRTPWRHPSHSLPTYFRACPSGLGSQAKTMVESGRVAVSRPPRLSKSRNLALPGAELARIVVKKAVLHRHPSTDSPLPALNLHLQSCYLCGLLCRAVSTLTKFSQDYGWGKELANYGEYSGAPTTEAAGCPRRSCSRFRAPRLAASARPLTTSGRILALHDHVQHHHRHRHRRHHSHNQ